MATKVIEKITKKNQGGLTYSRIGDGYSIFNPSKNYASYIETEDGKICLVNKSEIKKIFCSAEGRTQGVSESSELADTDKRDREHFISENVRSAGYEDEIEKIGKVENGELRAFLFDHITRPDGKGRADIRFFDACKIGDNGLPPRTSKDWAREATMEELQAYKKAMESANNSLLKRLNSYLKRYGLSKVMFV